MTQNQTSVLIIGAGPTGLTLACELARRGVSYRIIQATAGPQEGSRGKGVQPRTLEVFEDLGVIDRVLANGRLAMPMRSTDANGQVTRGGGEPDSLRGRPDIPYTTSLITPQWRVEETLRLRLAELGGGVEFGTELIRFQQSGEAVAAVVERDGRTETITARWLVGCDGGHSTVRRQAGIAFVGETRDEVRMLVADVRVDGLGSDAWHMWRHEEGSMTLCPLPSTEMFSTRRRSHRGRTHRSTSRICRRSSSAEPAGTTSGCTSRRGRRCGARTSGSPSAIGTAGCSSPAMRPTSTPRPAARA